MSFREKDGNGGRKRITLQKQRHGSSVERGIHGKCQTVSCDRQYHGVPPCQSSNQAGILKWKFKTSFESL